MSKDSAKEAAARSPVIHNRKAFFRFEIVDKFECGIMLGGPEVKSLREGRAHIDEAYAKFRGNELWLLQMHVEEYRHRGMVKLEPARPRKLLLHKVQLTRIADSVKRLGYTLVPLRVFWNERGIAKVELGLAKGKKLHDKRETEKRKTAKREMQRMVRRR